jgi:hypothetical protein
MSEWKLLVESEDIKIGDNISVERENGTIMVMKLTKYTEKFVTLKTPNKDLVKFYADSLESRYGSATIIGKHEGD